MEIREETYDLSSKFMNVVLTAVTTLASLSFCCLLDKKDHTERIAYSYFEPGNTIAEQAKYFGTCHLLEGFDRNRDGKIEEIKLSWLTAFGRGMCVPCSHTYFAQDKEFQPFYQNLTQTQKKQPFHLFLKQYHLLSGQ